MRTFRIVLAIIALSSIGCTDTKNAARILTNEGYSNVVLTGYDWFGCDEKDSFATGFTATNASGKPVKGVVCSGWLKGYTIRFH